MWTFFTNASTWVYSGHYFQCNNFWRRWQLVPTLVVSHEKNVHKNSPKMSTRSHPKNIHEISPQKRNFSEQKCPREFVKNVNKNSWKMSTRIQQFFPLKFALYIHKNSATQPKCEHYIFSDVRNWLEPSSGILHHYYLTRGSTLTSQDYSPSSVVYVPELTRAI